MNNDSFKPDTVEEQLEALSTSPMKASGTPTRRLVQDMERYRLEYDEEMHHALMRAWERIEGQRIYTPTFQIADEQIQLLQLPRSRPKRMQFVQQRFALISLVALLLILIGSAGLFFQYVNQQKITVSGSHKTVRTATSCNDHSGQACQPQQLAPKPSVVASPTATSPVVASPTATTPVAPGDLLASENFSSGKGILDGATGGSGWSDAWFVQNHNTNVPGYALSNSTPLHYPGLQIVDTYAVGGQNYLTAGRGIDAGSSGPFSSYLSDGLIGRSGKTLWLSVLLRKDSTTDQPLWVSLHNNNITWCAGCDSSQISIGYFAPGKDGRPYWSLELGKTIYPGNVLVTPGQTTLLILRLDFGTTTTCTLYVNPSTLGGDTPPAASVQGSTNTQTRIKNIAYYAGNLTNASSLTAIRLGSSYGAVTPTR